MTAELARKLDTCGSCGYVFTAGELLYRTRAKLTRCKTCAEKIGPLPQIVLPEVKQVQHPPLPKFTTFEARRAWKVVRDDWKQKASGG